MPDEPRVPTLDEARQLIGDLMFRVLFAEQALGALRGELEVARRERDEAVSALLEHTTEAEARRVRTFPASAG